MLFPEQENVKIDLKWIKSKKSVHPQLVYIMTVDSMRSVLRQTQHTINNILLDLDREWIFGIICDGTSRNNRAKHRISLSSSISLPNKIRFSRSFTHTHTFFVFSIDLVCLPHASQGKLTQSHGEWSHSVTMSYRCFVFYRVLALLYKWQFMFVCVRVYTFSLSFVLMRLALAARA